MVVVEPSYGKVQARCCSPLVVVVAVVVEMEAYDLVIMGWTL